MDQAFRMILNASYRVTNAEPLTPRCKRGGVSIFASTQHTTHFYQSYIMSPLAGFVSVFTSDSIIITPLMGFCSLNS